MTSMTQKLEQFLLDHTTPEDPVLEDLYRQTHIRFVNPNMATGHLQGKFLEFISIMIGPENILEIGTFTGYSAICLAKGPPRIDRGGITRPRTFPPPDAGPAIRHHPEDPGDPEGGRRRGHQRPPDARAAARLRRRCLTPGRWGGIFSG